MSFYRTGTASFTNGLTTIIGSGTDWNSGAAVGECVQAPDGKLYEILLITSATGITLGQPYLGATASGQAYSIVPTQSYIRDIASQAAALVNTYSETKTNAILLTVVDKATPVDADKFAIRDSVNGLAKLLTFANLRAALKDVSGGVAGLTGFAINIWNSVKSFKSLLSFSGTANRAHALPDKDGMLALLSDLTYKTQTGSVTITQAASNEMVRTHASAAVVLPIAYLDAGYQVVAEIESAAPFSGSAGLLLVSNRATNGFTLSMTGSATSATLRWKTLNPNA